jgi:hypothetical protein
LRTSAGAAGGIVLSTFFLVVCTRELRSEPRERAGPVGKTPGKAAKNVFLALRGNRTHPRPDNGLDPVE